MAAGALQLQSGHMQRERRIKVGWFHQHQIEALDPEDTPLEILRRERPDDSESSRRSRLAQFGLSFDKQDTTVANLSGGERARVLIAKLMLEPADLLLLDEPTNDLDIATLEILEESLLEFRGALVLVTHDRYLLDRVSTVVLGLDGLGNAGRFADYLQWEAWRDERQQEHDAGERSATTTPASNTAQSSRKKLSYLEAREYEAMEARLAEAEAALQRARETAENPAIASDAAQLQSALHELASAQAATDALYARWAELEAKLG